MIEADANRIAIQTRQRRAQAFAFRRHKGSFKLETANLNAFLLDGHTARFLSRERKWGVWGSRVTAGGILPPHKCGYTTAPCEM